MVYLYAGLGVAMLAGIMAIFDIGLALTGQRLLPPSADPYLNNLEAKIKDQNLLNLLPTGLMDPVDSTNAIDEGLRGTALCDALQASYEKLPGISSGDRIEGSMFPENDAFWGGSCVISAGIHRVLVRPGADGAEIPYRLFSCVLKGEAQRCSFELN